MLGHFAFQLAQQLRSLVRQKEAVAATVRGTAFHQPAVFEFVDHGNDRGTVEMGGIGQCLLGQSGIFPDYHEDAEKARRYAGFADGVREIGKDCALREPQLVADQAGQHAQRRRWAVACRAGSGGAARLFDIQQFGSHTCCR